MQKCHFRGLDHQGLNCKYKVEPHFIIIIIIFTSTPSLSFILKTKLYEQTLSVRQYKNPWNLETFSSNSVIQIYDKSFSTFPQFQKRVDGM